MSTPTELTLLREEATGDPAADLERSLTLLREVASGQRGNLLRLYRPAPTLAFGQRDRRLPGFEKAWETAISHGFTPVVRSAGGRAAAYHEGCLIVDQIQADPEPMLAHQGRFAEFGERFAQVLRSLGVDAAVGEVPGEYCPGEFSVNGRPAARVPESPTTGGRVKLVGTAQRVVAGAWLFTSVVVVDGADSLLKVTRNVYEDLGLALDPATVGAAADLVMPGAARLDVETLAEALLTHWNVASAAPADGGRARPRPVAS